MNLKKILKSKYKELSEEEKRQFRLVTVVIFSAFVLILPWIFSFAFLKENLISGFKGKTAIGLLVIIAVYIKIAFSLWQWVKREPER